MQTLSDKRLGRFTASAAYKLWPGERGGQSGRTTYIREKAQEIVTGKQKEFSNKHTDHGHMHEGEAIEKFAELSGLIVKPLQQQFFEINDYCGATPDAAVVNFDDCILATVDVKCPTATFFEQKMQFITESKPQYQNCPKEMFVQAQVQMLAVSLHNEKLGLPAIEKHFLVRYLTSSDLDYYGNTIEYDIPLNVRLFWAEIKADKKWQDEFLLYADSAVKERDLLVEIMRKPIIPIIEAIVEEPVPEPVNHEPTIKEIKRLKSKLGI